MSTFRNRKGRQLGEDVRSAFIREFNRDPLLVFSPARINLIGEHTDYNNGFVFPAAIDKYIISAFSETDIDSSRLFSLDMNQRVDIDLAKLEKRESGGWVNYVTGVAFELQARGNAIENFNLAFGGEIPIGAGLASSAALENSVVFGLNRLFDLGLTKDEMIAISVKAEHDFAGVKCGVMDQISNLRGKAGHALFVDCADLSFDYVPIDFRDQRFMLIDTNVRHKLSDSPYNNREEQCRAGVGFLQNRFPEIESLRDASRAQLESVKPDLSQVVYQRCLFVVEENERVILARKAVENKDWKRFGQLLYSSHIGLRDLYEVSCGELDFLVGYTENHPEVLGSRMMGGGFGGCTLNLVQKDFIEDFVSDLEAAYLLKFGVAIDAYPVNLSDGTRIIEN
jgi:galactokinase